MVVINDEVAAIVVAAVAFVTRGRHKLVPNSRQGSFEYY